MPARKYKGLPVTAEVFWAVVDLKDEGHYRSVDEALRPVLGLPAGPRPFLKEHVNAASAS